MQKPEDLPLDPRIEVDIAADRSSAAYRRGLRDLGLSHFFTALEQPWTAAPFPPASAPACPTGCSTNSPTTPPALPVVEDRMRLVHRLAERNHRENTGGPFAVVVSDTTTGEILSVGVNHVLAFDRPARARSGPVSAARRC